MGEPAEALRETMLASPLVPLAARLEDGRAVIVRSAQVSDLAGIVDFFERLGASSRYLRFFSPQPRLRRALVERVVAPGPDRMTVLAQPAHFTATSRRVVAVGGWIYVPAEDRCDVSIAVADDWQGVMLGTYVVLALLRDAVGRGHTRFSAEVLSSNARMLGLLRELGAPLRTSRDAGVVRLEFEVPAP